MDVIEMSKVDMLNVDDVATICGEWFEGPKDGTSEEFVEGDTGDVSNGVITVIEAVLGFTELELKLETVLVLVLVLMLKETLLNPGGLLRLLDVAL